MGETTNRHRSLLMMNDAKLKNRGDKEKLKFVKNKITPTKAPPTEGGMGEDFSKIPVPIRQRLGLNDVDDSGTVRNCRIVSDEYVREMMKKYGREIRRG